MQSLTQYRPRTMQDTSSVHRVASEPRRPQHMVGLARLTSAPAVPSQLGDAGSGRQSNSRLRALSLWEEDTELDPATLEWFAAQEFPKPAWDSCQANVVFLPIAFDAALDASTVDWLQTQEFPTRAFLCDQPGPVQGSDYHVPVSLLLERPIPQPPARTHAADRGCLNAFSTYLPDNPITETTSIQGGIS